MSWSLSTSSRTVSVWPARSIVQRRRLCTVSAWEGWRPWTSGNSAVDAAVATSATIVSPSSHMLSSWNMCRGSISNHRTSAAVPSRGITPSFVGRSGTQASIGPPRFARSRSWSSGVTGKTTWFAVTRNVCMRLMCGIGMISVFRGLPVASMMS